ncbi:MAG: DUF2059 domain-containing protein [Paludibacteraceae bacterium]|nr:DUF2059 domain-containing protein [Paludibacteraceae bacterium]
MKKIVITFITIVAVCLSAMAQETKDEYTLEVERNLALSNTEQVVATALGGVYVKMKDKLNLSEQKCLELGVFMANKMMPMLVPVATEVYKKYFSLSEIKEINAFYESSVGKKYFENSAAITQETMDKLSEFTPLIIGDVQNFISENQSK